MRHHETMLGEMLRQAGLTDTHLQLVGRVVVLASFVEARLCDQIVHLEGRDYAEWQAFVRDPVSKKLRRIKQFVGGLDASYAFKASFLRAVDALDATFHTRHDLVHGAFFPVAMFGLPDVAPFAMRPATPEHTLGRPAQFDEGELHTLCDDLADHCGELERHVAAIRIARGQARPGYGGEEVQKLVQLLRPSRDLPGS